MSYLDRTKSLQPGRRWLPIVVCVIFVGEVGAAQGEFIRRGENAFGVGVSLGVSRPLNTLSGLAALSALGTFDIGVAYREDVDEVIKVVKRVDAEMRDDPDFKTDILEPIE